MDHVFHLCLTNAASSHGRKASVVTSNLSMPLAKSCHLEIKIDIRLHTVILFFYVCFKGYKENMESRQLCS